MFTQRLSSLLLRGPAAGSCRISGLQLPLRPSKVLCRATQAGCRRHYSSASSIPNGAGGGRGRGGGAGTTSSSWTTSRVILVASLTGIAAFAGGSLRPWGTGGCGAEEGGEIATPSSVASSIGLPEKEPRYGTLEEMMKVRFGFIFCFNGPAAGFGYPWKIYELAPERVDTEDYMLTLTGYSPTGRPRDPNPPRPRLYQHGRRSAQTPRLLRMVNH